MNDTNSKQLQAKRWGKLIYFFPLGVGLALLSLLEGSSIWAGYCVITAWLGTASGLAGSQGLTQRVLATGNTNASGSMSSWRYQATSIFTFWGPNIAVIFFGGMLAQYLSDTSDFQRSPLIMFESMAMYFCGIGAAWSGLWRHSRQR